MLQSNKLINNDFPELDWYISVSFNKSSSANFTKALLLAQQTSYKYYETTFDGLTIYQGVFTKEREQYLNFIQLYELVSSWKSSFAMINGKLVDRKIIGGLNYCYGDRCRSGKSDFCFGASWATENPFGCHRLQISATNNPWWSFSYQQGNKMIIDKHAIKKRIDEYCTAYTECPSFDYDDIIQRLNTLPDFLTLSKYSEITNRPVATTTIETMNDSYNINQIECEKRRPLNQPTKTYSPAMYKVCSICMLICGLGFLFLSVFAPPFIVLSIFCFIFWRIFLKKSKE